MGEKARWVLPAVVDPSDSLCFQVHVPNDRQHIAAFYGAIFSLVKPYNWQNDAGHTAVLVGAVWGRIFDELMNQQCPIPSIKGAAGSEIEEFMAIRVDCNCDVWITCCDGTEKQLLTSDQVKALIGGQPGIGASQPRPNGGQSCYHAILNANSQFYLPTSVSDGDVITISSISGAVSNSHNSEWRCPSGYQFWLGACVGVQATDSSNFLPTAHTSTLVALIDGVYYPLESGTLTVSGGHSHAAVLIMVNDASLVGLAGQYVFDVCVTNNGTEAWHIHLDFTASNHSWQQLPQSHQAGVWVAGQGWQSECAGDVPNILNECYIGANFVAHLTRLIITLDYSAGTFASTTQAFAYYDQSGSFNVLNNGSVPVGGGVQIDTGVISRNVTKLGWDLNASHTASFGACDGSALITALDLYGDGPMPAL